MQALVSVVVPVLDEAANIEPLAEAIKKVLGPSRRYELVFVDDGSTDGTLEALRLLAARDRRVRYLSFSRNFGHQTALKAGMEASRGDCVITMDGDFQHPPELIPLMLEAWEKGFDIVQGKRLDLKEGADRAGAGEAGTGQSGLVKRLGTRAFYRLVNLLGDVRIEPGTADFRLVSARARRAVLAMPERNLFLRGAFPWTGLPATEIEYRPGARRSGATKYSLSRMLALALEGVTSFSVKPLRLSAFAGIGIALAGFTYALYALAIRLFTDRTVEGWTSILASVLVIGGMQLCSLGIIGEYLGKLFLESKGRPAYILKETSPIPEEIEP